MGRRCAHKRSEERGKETHMEKSTPPVADTVREPIIVFLATGSLDAAMPVRSSVAGGDEKEEEGSEVQQGRGNSGSSNGEPLPPSQRQGGSNITAPGGGGEEASPHRHCDYCGDELRGKVSVPLPESYRDGVYYVAKERFCGFACARKAIFSGDGGPQTEYREAVLSSLLRSLESRTTVGAPRRGDSASFCVATGLGGEGAPPSVVGAPSSLSLEEMLPHPYRISESSIRIRLKKVPE